MTAKMTVERVTTKQQVDQYQLYFAEARLSVNQQQLLELLKKDGVLINSYPQTRAASELNLPILYNVRVQPTSVAANAALITYLVQVGPLVLNVRLLNLQGEAPLSTKQPVRKANNDSTSVLRGRSTNRVQFVSKRFYFADPQRKLKKREQETEWHILRKYSDLEIMIVEYSLARVCSALRVGIKVGYPDNGFDILCYEDCAEFAMERCWPMPNKSYTKLQLEDIENRLKYCITVMHQFGLVHKDIKPDNIMVNGHGQVMLIDFGVSAFIHQGIGHKSLSYKEGTRRFMSAEMLALAKEQCGWVDLYYNDLCGLRLTVRALSQLDGSFQKRYGPSAKIVLPLGVEPVEAAVKILGDVLDGKTIEGSPQSIQLMYALFSPYFSQLDRSAEKEKVNLHFLVRSIGLATSLLQYFLPTLNPNTEALLRRLMTQKERQSSETSLACTTLNIYYLGFLRRLANRFDGGLVCRCDLELSIAWQLQLNGQKVESQQILSKASEYLPESYRERYAILLLNGMFLNGSGGEEDIRRILEKIEQTSTLQLLAVGAEACFKRQDHRLTLVLLRRIFPKTESFQELPSSASVMKFVHQVLSASTPSAISFVLLRIFLEGAMRNKLYHLLLDFDMKIPEELPGLQVLYLQAKGNAKILVGDLPSALRCYQQADAIVLSEKQGHYTIRGVCNQLVNYELIQHLDGGLDRNLMRMFDSFTGFTSHQDIVMVGQVHGLLMCMELLEEKFTRCMERALAVANIIRTLRKQFNHYPSFGSYYFKQLSYITDFKQLSQQISQAMQLVDDEITNGVNAHLDILQKFQWHMDLIVVYERLGLRKKAQLQVQHRLEIIKLHQSTLSAELTIKIAVEISGAGYCRSQSNTQIATKLLLFADELLTPHKESLTAQNLLACCPGFVLLSVLGHKEKYQKWIALTIKRLQEENDNKHESLREQAAKVMLKYGYSRHIIPIVGKCLNNGGLCTYFSAINLYEEEKLRKELLLKFTNNFSFQKASFYQRPYVINAHMALYKISLKEGKDSKPLLDKIIWMFENLKPHPHQEQIFLSMELYFYWEQGLTRLELQTRRRIYERFKGDSLFPEDRIKLVVTLATMAHSNKNYRGAAKCFSKGLVGGCEGAMSLAGWLVLAKSYVTIRDTRGFYKVARRLKEDFPDSIGELAIYLRQRRESVKEYLVVGKYSEKSKDLTRVLELLTTNSPIILPKEPKQLLNNIVMLKRLRMQSLYSSNINQQDQIVRRILQLLSK